MDDKWQPCDILFIICFSVRLSSIYKFIDLDMKYKGNIMPNMLYVDIT